MVAAATTPEVDRRLINVGSGTETVVREVVQRVLEITGSSAEVVYNPRTDPGVSRMCANLALARKTLGYEPRVSLADGIRMTLERDPRFSKAVPEG